MRIGNNNNMNGGHFEVKHRTNVIKLPSIFKMDCVIEIYSFRSNIPDSKLANALENLNRDTPGIFHNKETKIKRTLGNLLEHLLHERKERAEKNHMAKFADLVIEVKDFNEKDSKLTLLIYFQFLARGNPPNVYGKFELQL